ncbi:MAG: valine--tRNA ligase [Myxococcales bacterium]|nr:valine--tRNA ligase [Myxococcales bacterium]
MTTDSSSEAGAAAPAAAADPTPEGGLSKGFEPAEIEARWYAYWLEHGVFHASEAADDTRPTYVLPMPLPNVTGSLHMGHAMMCTFEDILARAHRMLGRNTLYAPGTDHAGIATQVVVERQLAREGKTRHELGREAFLERVWQWKGQAGGRIVEQQKALGLSADWARSKFTMDPDYARGVREAFVRLYEEGLIYRDTRLIHWDCQAQTVLSNLEVNNEEENGELYEFAYPIEGGGEIVVATTRPETMLGDTAVAVHPDDPRYKDVVGKNVVHPLLDRKFPIIADAVLVDPKFGTGAVKVTPAHDFNDHETGKRHGLPVLAILDKAGRVNEHGGSFAGLDRFEARKAVKRALKDKGLVRGSKQHKLVIPRSDRTETVVEPMLSTQWFVRTKPLAEPALAAVEKGETIILPEEWTKTYAHWMQNILDWCISRQLWWGHRIPAFYCDKCEHVTVTRADRPTACGGCGATELRQDEDVLDTWFSSALWPFAYHGWPDDTAALRRFYPASDLETGYDILFFWVARMMMMGIHFLGKPPFARILLHPIVVDETGDKMSKVKGNVIDPLDLMHGASFDEVVRKALPGAPIEEALAKFKKAYPSSASMGKGFEAYGTDALRFTLASYSALSKRIPLSPKKIEGNRHFCNKIWNATRFALPYLEGVVRTDAVPEAKSLPNRWLLARLAGTMSAVRAGIDGFRFDEATAALYRFVWGDLCDWYLEMCKPVLGPTATDVSAAERAEWQRVLAHTLDAVLRGLHPFMPFLTEELWQRLPRPAGVPVSIALAKLPGPEDGRADPEAERAMDIVQAAVVAARTIRSERDVHPGSKVHLELRSSDPAVRALLLGERRFVETLVRTDGAVVVADRAGERPRGVAMTMAREVEVLLTLRGVVDAVKERARIEREIKRTEKDVGVLEKKLASKGFAERAPAEVVAEAKSELAAMQARLELLAEAKKLADELE